MKFKFLKTTFANLILSASCLVSIASANLIEVDIYHDGTNKGFAFEDGTLEWMDFGVNNHIFVADVFTGIQSGGQFEGWRLPTESEIQALWYKTVFIDFTDMWINNSDKSAIYAVPSATWASPYLVEAERFEALYERLIELGSIMGWNTPYGAGHGSSAGAYLTVDGRLSYTGFQIVPDFGWAGIPYLQADFYDNNMQYSTDIGLSTMLVRSQTLDVPEPSTLAIFVLGLMGLASRRFKKQV